MGAIEHAAPEITNEARLIHEGITLPVACAPWKLRPIVPPAVILEAFQHSGVRDSVSLWGFGAQITSGEDLFFTSYGGWIWVQDIRKGASASIHGGCWNDRRGHDETLIAPTHALLDWLYEALDLHVLTSAYAEHNRAAAVWDRQFGFERTGVVPFADFWDGKARNLVITARFRKDS